MTFNTAIHSLPDRNNWKLPRMTRQTDFQDLLQWGLYAAKNKHRRGIHRLHRCRMSEPERLLRLAEPLSGRAEPINRRTVNQIHDRYLMRFRRTVYEATRNKRSLSDDGNETEHFGSRFFSQRLRDVKASRVGDVWKCGRTKWAKNLEFSDPHKKTEWAKIAHVMKINGRPGRCKARIKIRGVLRLASCDIRP